MMMKLVGAYNIQGAKQQHHQDIYTLIIIVVELLHASIYIFSAIMILYGYAFIG